MTTRADISKPGTFSKQVAADARRMEFDFKNDVIVSRKTEVGFVFMGDSITHMWELNAYFHSDKGMIANRGIGGDTTEYISKRFYADAIQLNPGLVILMAGTNDVFQIGDDLWWGVKGKDEAEVEAQAVENIQSVIGIVSETGIRLALCSVLPTRQFWNNKSREKNELILRINEKYKSLAKEHNLIYVDYHALLVESDGMTMRDGLSVDGVHPHVLGYDIMADVLRDTLAQSGIRI